MGTAYSKLLLVEAFLLPIGKGRRPSILPETGR
jgi:hypothetical protein